MAEVVGDPTCSALCECFLYHVAYSGGREGGGASAVGRPDPEVGGASACCHPVERKGHGRHTGWLVLGRSAHSRVLS